MTKKQRSTIILTLGALTAIGPLSIDMYLPGFPSIADSLHTDIAHVTLSLTSYFAGISIGQLIYGPLIDRFGRKRPLLIGLLVYLVAAIGCALVPNVNTLIAFRLVLALGGCVGMVASRAVVRDLFPVSENAKIFSSLILVMGVAPIIAPSVGSFICTHLGWRFIFVFLALFAALLFAAVAWLLPESKGADHTISLRFTNIAKGYFEVLKNAEFIVYAVGGGLIWSGLYTYISGSSFVYMKLLGFTEKQFGLLFALNACGLILGSQLNRRLLRLTSSQHVVRIVAFVLLVVALVLIGEVVFSVNPLWTLPLFFILLFGLGFLNPNTSALAMSPFHKNAGSASALMGFIQMILGASASALVSKLYDGTAHPMMLVMAGGAIVGFIFVYKHKPATVVEK